MATSRMHRPTHHPQQLPIHQKYPAIRVIPSAEGKATDTSDAVISQTETTEGSTPPPTSSAPVARGSGPLAMRGINKPSSPTVDPSKLQGGSTTAGKKKRERLDRDLEEKKIRQLKTIPVGVSLFRQHATATFQDFRTECQTCITR